MGTELERFVPAEWSKKKGRSRAREREEGADVMNKEPSVSSLTAL